MRPNLANHSNGFDMSEVNRSKVALLPDDIIEKYKEAISHYAKVGFLFLVLIFATITDQTSCSSVNFVFNFFGRHLPLFLCGIFGHLCIFAFKRFYHLYHLHMRVGNVFGHVCLSVCLFRL